ncbi:hypothetical protein FO519_008941, partial [Halicephalobus sp. NKZ332]
MNESNIKLYVQQRPTPEAIQEFREIFTNSLEVVVNLKCDVYGSVDEDITDFMETIFDYAKARRLSETDELMLWKDEERKKFVEKFPESLEKLKKYLLPAIQNLDKENPVINKVYKSAFVFLREDIFNIYKNLEDSEELHKQIEIQLESLVSYEEHLPVCKTDFYFLPDLKGIFIKKFPKSLEKLKQYLLSAIKSLKNRDLINSKVYKSAFVFLREDIFNIYKEIENSEELHKQIEIQLESLIDYEEHLHICKTVFYFLPDLKGISISHDWWESQKHPELEEITEDINQIINSLTSDEARTQAKEMANEYKELDEKICFIKNIRQIKKRNTFFELIKKTRATVHFVDDGMVISSGKLSEIKLHPKAYNQIGDFTGKIKEIKKNKTAIELLAVYDKCRKKTKDKKAFKDKLRQILDESSEKHLQAAFMLLNDEEYKNCNFEKVDIENIVTEGLKNTLYKAIQVPKMPENIQSDFGKFCDLQVKEIKGQLTKEDPGLIELRNICEVHRKEYFFNSITEHATHILYMEESDKLERELGRGKNLEEWKSEKAKLDSKFKNDEVNEEVYNQMSREIEQKIKEAEEVRRFKLVMDKLVLSGEGSNERISNRGQMERFTYVAYKKYVNNILQK